MDTKTIKKKPGFLTEIDFRKNDIEKV